MSERVAHIARTTKETDIDLSVGLDGTGKTDVFNFMTEFQIVVL